MIDRAVGAPRNAAGRSGASRSGDGRPRATMPPGLAVCIALCASPMCFAAPAAGPAAGPSGFGRLDDAALTILDPEYTALAAAIAAADDVELRRVSERLRRIATEHPDTAPDALYARLRALEAVGDRAGFVAQIRELCGLQIADARLRQRRQMLAARAVVGLQGGRHAAWFFDAVGAGAGAFESEAEAPSLRRLNQRLARTPEYKERVRLIASAIADETTALGRVPPGSPERKETAAVIEEMRHLSIETHYRALAISELQPEVKAYLDDYGPRGRYSDLVLYQLLRARNELRSHNLPVGSAGATDDAWVRKWVSDVAAAGPTPFGSKLKEQWENWRTGAHTRPATSQPAATQPAPGGGSGLYRARQPAK